MTIFTDNDIAILNQAIDTYGPAAQTNMIIEECAELIVALQKLEREPANAKRLNNVAAEIADVMIMCEQARLMFGCEQVNNAVRYKLDRLERRLNDGENH